jgi:deoxyribodipyrimidine photo-lyase
LTDFTSPVQKLLDEKNIPLLVDTYTGNRFCLPQHLATNILPRLKATHVFGNIEYEVDELRRDTEVVKVGAAIDGKERVKAVFVHDRLAVAPGILKSGKGTPYAVYSPWQRRKSDSATPPSSADSPLGM